jgi:hypothetical protein
MSEVGVSPGAADVRSEHKDGVFPTPAVAEALSIAIQTHADSSTHESGLGEAIRVFAVEARQRGVLPEQALVSLKAIARVTPNYSTYQLRSEKPDAVGCAVKLLIEEYFR